MKSICIIFLALVTVCHSYATISPIKAIGNDTWTSGLTWDLQRQPQDNDTVIIPVNITVRIDKSIKLNNVTIKVYGTLNFNNGKMDLDNKSHVIILSGGNITGSKNSEYIDIGGIEKYLGTNPSISGYAFADATTGSSFLQGSFLPVTLIAFYATLSGDNVLLTWSTAQEFNNNRFEIERSYDGRSWEHVTEVISNGNNSMGSKYSYTDRNTATANIYYRILQVDAFNHFQYSPVKRVHKGEVSQPANIYASSKQAVTIDFNSEVKNNIRVNVLNMNGQLIARKDYPQSTYSITMNIPSVVRGMYVVQVSDNNGMNEVKKLIF